MSVPVAVAVALALGLVLLILAWLKGLLGGDEVRCSAAAWRNSRALTTAQLEGAELRFARCDLAGRFHHPVHGLLCAHHFRVALAQDEAAR